MSPRREQSIRFVIGTAIMLGSLALASVLSESRTKARHERYQECVARGGEPLKCSFLAYFKGEDT